jgi:para-nitrobenzyl esterase
MEGGRRRALHTIDIPLVFDNIHKEGAKAGTGPEAQAVADAMSSAFIAHARARGPEPPRHTLVASVHPAAPG